VEGFFLRVYDKLTAKKTLKSKQYFCEVILMISPIFLTNTTMIIATATTATDHNIMVIFSSSVMTLLMSAKPAVKTSPSAKHIQKLEQAMALFCFKTAERFN